MIKPNARAALSPGIVSGADMILELESHGWDCGATDTAHQLLDQCQALGRRIGPDTYTLVRMRFEGRDQRPVMDYWVLGAIKAPTYHAVGFT